MENLLSSQRGTISDMTASGFKHAPIQPRQVRLLQLFSEDDVSSLVSGICLPISLDNHFIDTKPFIALSYFWGDPTPTHVIRINGSHFGVTENLHNYLRRAQKRAKSHNRFLWIDAICIDQENTGEREQQVGLMAELYSRAETVHIWLGESKDDSDRAFGFIQELGSRFPGLSPNLKCAAGQAPEQILRNDPNFWTSYKSGVLMALEKLVVRPWFTRTWVIQELTLAQVSVVLCGAQEVTWDLLSGVVGIITRLQVEGFGGTDTPEKMAIKEALANLVKYFNMIERLADIKERYHAGDSGKRSLIMSHILQSTAAFEAKDSRDKIYGTLGIVHDREALEIEPDYKISTVDLYAKVTEKILVKEGSLKLLEAAGIGWPRLLSELPSWTPDYTDLDKMIMTLPERHGTTEADLRMNFNSDGKQLRLTGQIVDALTEVGSSEVQNHHDFPAWVLEVEKEFHAKGTGEAFWRTIIGSHVEGKGTSEELLKDAKVFRSACDSVLCSLDYDTQKNAQIHGFWNYAFLACRRRRFCVTRGGRFGLVPGGSKVGDQVFMVRGGQSPLLIRQLDLGEVVSSEYQLVGTCYIHDTAESKSFDWESDRKEIVLV